MIQNCKCAISIIIPTYNVESYIARCLDSCINQTLHNIEILVIDDCGSDDSIAIAQRYADKDSRIRIIHNEKNLGTFGSRIEGIKAAGGRYIAFLDADDYLKLETCEKMLQLFTDSTLANTHTLIDLKTVESTPDIIHFKSHYTVNKQTKPLAKLTHYTRYMLPTRFSKAPLHNEQIAYNFFLNSKQFPKFTIWDKCYKTALVKQTLPLIESFIPLKLTMAEDMLKFFVISAFAKSYVSVDSRLYMYCLNDGSITQNPQAKQKKINDMSYIIQALHSLSKELKSHNALMPTIAQVMSKNLAALIILESRLSGMHGGGGYSRISTQLYIAFCGYATILARFFALHANDRDSSSAYATCGIRAYPSTQDVKIYALYPLTILTLLHIVITILESLPYLYPHFCLHSKPRQNQTLNLFNLIILKAHQCL
ncbi:glycosyltransferase family 2 protein [Helicobacter cinaedi]|uniref:glycosyltransferase family 2 protein n=1 Tax=Helicobacter cinaedi TaxID=213 RepID=UPI000DA1F0AD|nr:glycosyltransferase family 2 protein [Helicobacter cinaedi]